MKMKITKTLIVLGLLGAYGHVIASNKFSQCQVKYGYSGGASTWTTYAESEQDAIYRWQKKIQKGDNKKHVISVKCK
jgi:hypothetical protein